VVKIIVAKAVFNFDEKDIEQIVTVWYQFDVVFAVSKLYLIVL